MRKVCLGLGIIAVFIFAGSVLAQDPAVQEAPAAEVTLPQPALPAEPETQWVWGEVVSLDISKGEVVVKYLDYETDQEKELTVAADNKTTYENAKSLADIKAKDALSIDYVVSADGKNITKNISVEKPEAEIPAVAEEVPVEAPVVAQPETAQQQ